MKEIIKKFNFFLFISVFFLLVYLIVNFENESLTLSRIKTAYSQTGHNFDCIKISLRFPPYTVNIYCSGDAPFLSNWLQYDCENKLRQVGVSTNFCSTNCDLGTCHSDCKSTYGNLSFPNRCSLYMVQSYQLSGSGIDEGTIVTCYRFTEQNDRVCSIAAKSQNNSGASTPPGYLYAGNCQCLANERLAIICCKDGKVYNHYSYASDNITPPLEGWCSPGTDKIVFAGSASRGVINRILARGWFYDPNFPSFNPTDDSTKYCGGGQIFCSVTSTSQQGSIKVTASTTASSGIIEITVPSQTSHSCVVSQNSRTCEATFNNLSGRINATAKLKSNDGNTVIASTTCSVVLVIPTTTIPTPGEPPSSGGVCSPYLFARVSDNEQFPTSSTREGRIVIFNTPTSVQPILNKGKNIYMDVKLMNAGRNLTANCEYKECLEHEHGYRYYNTTTQRVEYTCGGSICYIFECVRDHNVKCNCKTWSDKKNETISNPPDCKIGRTENDYIKVKFSILSDKVFKITMNDILHGVISGSRINHETVKINTFNTWSKDIRGSNNTPLNQTVSLKPERHGIYYIDIGKIEGNIYNLPNKIEVKDDPNEKNYIKCTVNQLGGGSVTFEDPNETTYDTHWVLWDETRSDRRDVKGIDPLNVPGSQIRFYVRYTEVDPYISLTSNPPYPNVKTQRRNYIVNFPININYGVNIGGYWGKDMGEFWLEIGNQLIENKNIIRDGSNSNSYTYKPETAGSLTLCSVHDADDEERSIIRNLEAWGNEERSCQQIDVYRYICYQGFCYECPKEPYGTPPDLRAADCKVVEPQKCFTYIRSDCRSRGRE